LTNAGRTIINKGLSRQRDPETWLPAARQGGGQ